MKRLFLFIAFVGAWIYMQAGVTTYTFTSLKWASQVGATKCDGTTDGWTSNQDATEYQSGRTDAQGRLYSKGVGVKTTTSGAGATSVKSFTKVRRVTINFCQNSSKGKGVVYIQVGQNTPDSLVIHKPAKSGEGVYNRDSTIAISGEPTGKIKFWINCSENAIYLNTLTVRSEDGGSPFTQDTYQLVTDITQLKDSDQIIFGASKSDYIMGYFDETVSKNNIAAIQGRFTADHQSVGENQAAIYTLRTIQHAGKTRYLFVDEIRYELAYLVASGGSTKNRLALWDDYTSRAYGDYGIWDIDIAINGEATITSQGTSLGKYIQLNAGSPSGPIFACYQNLNYESVGIYRCVKAIGDKPAIVAPMCNFGVTTLSGSSVSGNQTIQVNANKLTQDITCTLNQGSVFSLSTHTIDRDGDNLTISYQATATGRYIDTLVLTSDTVHYEALVLLDVQPIRTIAQVTRLEDYTTVYLNPVVVTKKYDKYVFIKDQTSSMLIWDATNPKTGKPYAQGLSKGDQLIGVQGVFQNYYGVPELSPAAAWSVAAQKVEVIPDTVLDVDSADVCRYVCIQNVVVENNRWNGKAVVDAFNTGIVSSVATTLEAIVMIDHDAVQLWVVNQTLPAGLSSIYEASNACYKMIKNNHLIICREGKQYMVNGQMINE